MGGQAALSPSLMEAELFGHEEGAFTGASRSRVGRFRRAAGGTLLLGGVEALPDGLQVKLLRVLQERCVEPLGSEESHPIDVRVVATSSPDLAAQVRARSFREDLYYRLAVIVLRVPPLRARAEDLPELVQALAGAIARRTGVAPRPFPARTLERELMGDTSEEFWCASWLIDCEYSLWWMVLNGPVKWGHGTPAAGTIERLRALSEQAGGWWRWSDEHRQVFVPAEEWAARYAQHVGAYR